MENNDQLCHHGVKGQKWGVRRTPAQLGYKTSSKKKKRTSLSADWKARREARRKSNAEAKQKKELEAKQKSEAEKKADIEAKKQKILKSRSAKNLYDNADLFTTQELQSAYNRLALERNISNLSPKEISKGEQFVNKVIHVGEKANKLASVGTDSYNHFARFYNTFSEKGKNKPLPTIKKDSDGKKKKKNDNDDDDSSDDVNSKSSKKSKDSKNDKTSTKTNNEGSKKNDEPDVEILFGTVEGSGGSNKQTYDKKTKSKVDDIIDAEFWSETTVSDLPAVFKPTDNDWLDDLLD